MSIKDAKSFGLLPRISTTEKKIYSALSTFGASTVEEISERASVSKGRVSSTLPKLEKRGLVAPLEESDSTPRRYVALFPIENFTKVLAKLTDSLEARKSELEAITKVVNDFTENAIKKVRESSKEERGKRMERSEQDIKELEMAMDASLSGILASVEMDLKDLGRIANTSTAFLAESSIRTEETYANIARKLQPISQRFAEALAEAQSESSNKLESVVDARVSDILDLEIIAGQALDEVLDAFQDSKDEFEEIIFTLLNAGLDDLEKVTRPIGDQIEEAMNLFIQAIKEAANYFQSEILRVLVEQKRPIITSIEGLPPTIGKAVAGFLDRQHESLALQFQSLNKLLENHSSIFAQAAGTLSTEYDKRVEENVQQTLEKTSKIHSELSQFDQEFTGIADRLLEEKREVIHSASRTTRDALSDMKEQFIVILNRSVAMYQLALGDLVATLESEFLSAIESNGASIQNLANFINLQLTEPVRTAVNNLMTQTQTMREEQLGYLKKFEESFNKDIFRINDKFGQSTKKTEQALEKDFTNLRRRFEKEVKGKLAFSSSRASAYQKDLREIMRDFSTQLRKELTEANKDLANNTKKLKNWHKENSKMLSEKLDERIARNLNDLSHQTTLIIEQINSEGDLNKEELIKLVEESLGKVSAGVKELGTEIKGELQESIDDLVDALRKENEGINKRLTNFKKSQEELIKDTKDPLGELIQGFQEGYNDLYRSLNNSLQRLIPEKIDAFKKNREKLDKMLEDTFTRRRTRTSKEVADFKKDFEKSIRKYEERTKDSFEAAERSLGKEVRSVLDQEGNARASIVSIIEKTVSDLTNNVNTTAEELRTTLWEGTETIFGQATAEISKQEIKINELNDIYREEAVNNFLKGTALLRNQFGLFNTEISQIKASQLESSADFKDQFSHLLENDLTDQLASLQAKKEEISKASEAHAEELKENVERTVNATIQELEIHTIGIEGALFDTVGKIIADSERRTEGVIGRGEQAILEIERRYTENLEKIRHNLTDEVIQRVDKEAKKIGEYKEEIKKMGREHLRLYGKKVSDLNDAVQEDLSKAGKDVLRTISVCETFSRKFLEELNNEINAMGSRAELGTDRLIKELVEGFDRVLQKIKREATLFAQKQFDLSNRSSQEIAEAFLKSVDDLEEVILKQIANFSQRTNATIERTEEISAIVNKSIKEMMDTFDKLRET